MNNVGNRLPHANRPLRGLILAGAALLSACSPGEQSNEPYPATTRMPPATWTYEAPTPVDCLDAPPEAALGTYDEPDQFAPEHADGELRFDINAYLKLYPTHSPMELIDQYMTDQSAALNRTPLKVELDSNTVPTAWQSTEKFKLLFEKQVVIGRTRNLLRALSEYPPALLPSLGVDTLRIANQYEYYEGHYDNANNEVLVEFDSLSSSDAGLDDLRAILDHEIVGHAFHSTFCTPNFKTDTEVSTLNQDFAYIGYPSDSDTEEAKSAHYAAVPNVKYTVGPERLFARNYAASSVQEDVATIIEMTRNERGLIQEGDADYGSPLQQKQQLLVNRIESKLPGFRASCERLTTYLRRQSHNEINQFTKKVVALDPAGVPETDLNLGGQYGTVVEGTRIAVLNGVFYNEMSSGKKRSGELIQNPAIEFDEHNRPKTMYYKGKEIGISGVAPISADSGLTFFAASDTAPMFHVMTGEEWLETVDVVNVTSTKLDEFFAGKPQMVTLTF